MKVPGLYQRNQTWWYRRMHKGKRVAISLDTSDFADAVRRLEEIKDSPELNPGGLLAAEIERYLKFKQSRGLFSRHTEATAKVMLGRLCKEFGKVPPGTISGTKAQSYYDRLRSKMAEVTAQTYVAHARSFFTWCKDENIVRENPFANLTFGRVVSAARKEFCEAPLRNRLIEECSRSDLKFVLYCGFHAGLRRNEIIEARPAWFDLKRSLITIRKIAPAEAIARGLDPFDLKDREERTIPLSKAFGSFLKEWMDPNSDYCLSPSTRRGRSRYRYDFRRFFDDYMKEQDCEWVTAHTMRRTFASLHASSGTPLYHIAKWLGDDIRTTQKHYAHLAPDSGIFEKGLA